MSNQGYYNNQQPQYGGQPQYPPNVCFRLYCHRHIDLLAISWIILAHGMEEEEEADFGVIHRLMEDHHHNKAIINKALHL